MDATFADSPVGRDRERSALQDRLRQLIAGAGSVAWLEGEPGIGKSVLVDALVAEAASLRVTVLRAAGDEIAQRFPLYLMAGCVDASVGSPDPARAEIAALIRGGEDRVLDPVLAASERILDLVDRLCAAGPVVLAAEDLHWSDLASLALWERLARAVDQIPLLLVGTSRPAGRRPKVARLREVTVDREGLILVLPPLEDARVSELAGRLLGGKPSAELAGDLTRCGGNPLFVRELVAGLVGAAAVEVVEGVARLRWGSVGLPHTVAAAIQRRLALLRPRTRDVLRLAALLGNEVDARELALVTGRPVDLLAAPLDEAVGEGVLSESGSRLAFRHALIRDALEGELTASVRGALHAQFARALAEAGAPVNSVVRHLLAVPGTLDGWVARWAAELPATALFAAPEVATELLDRILGSPGLVDQFRDLLLARQVVAVFWSGDNARAGELVTTGLHSVDDPELRGRMRLYQVRIASRMARQEAALAIAEAAIADGRLPAVWRTRIRAWAAIVRLKQDQHEVASRQADLALAEATVLADPLAVGYARHALSHLSTGTTALGYVDAGLAGLGDDPDAMELRLLMLAYRLALLNNLGRREEFATTVSHALILASRVGTVQVGRIQWAAAMGCYDFGAWDEALAHLDSLQPPLSAPKLIGRHGLAALIAAHREEWDQVREHTEAGSAVTIIPGDVRIYSGYLVAARAMRAQADGDPTRAVDLLARWLETDLGYDAKERFMWLPDLVRLALCIGDASTARAAADAAAADAKESDAIPRQRAAADLCRGQLDDDVTMLRTAADTYQCHGWAIGHAAALEEIAVRLAAEHDVSAARAALTAAARGYADLGATWDMRRADARLRPHGIRRGARSLYRRATTGWAALTPTELRVAELAAQGRSNPDIAAELYLSRRTVQAHVSHILAKLNLRSRLEIGTVAQRR